MMEAIDFARVAESTIQAHKRIDTLEKRVDDIHVMASAVARLDEKVDHMAETINEVKGDVKAISARPGKRWDKLTGAAITALATGLVAAVVALILK